MWRQSAAGLYVLTPSATQGVIGSWGRLGSCSLWLTCRGSAVMSMARWNVASKPCAGCGVVAGAAEPTRALQAGPGRPSAPALQGRLRVCSCSCVRVRMCLDGRLQAKPGRRAHPFSSSRPQPASEAGVHTAVRPQRAEHHTVSAVLCCSVDVLEHDLARPRNITTSRHHGAGRNTSSYTAFQALG